MLTLESRCNKLNYMDANSLIQAILKAFTIEDGEEDIPIGKILNEASHA